MGPAQARPAERRAGGANRAMGEEVPRRIARAKKKHREAQMAWEREHDGEVFDPELFRSESLAGLRTTRTIDLARLNGLSVPYRALIKKGKRVPHPMHWVL